MEGAPLKSMISLLQIATSEAEIFIFDVLKLGQCIFDSEYLLPILTNPGILKLCYDCRCDAEALFHQHNIHVHGFYDLQIVYTSIFQNASDPYLKGLHRAIEHLLTAKNASEFLKQKKMIRQLWKDHDGISKTILRRPLSQVIYL